MCVMCGDVTFFCCFCYGYVNLRVRHVLTHSFPTRRSSDLLERLSAGPARASGSDTLWPVLRASAVSKTHLSSEVVRQLNTFRDHLNTAFGNPDMPVIPPGPDGKPWRITTRQFRRTIAWHIANRPFGTIAGMIQYKHASVAAFEGYAGRSEEHTSELQSLMRISYAVFCLKKKTKNHYMTQQIQH